MTSLEPLLFWAHQLYRDLVFMSTFAGHAWIVMPLLGIAGLISPHRLAAAARDGRLPPPSLWGSPGLELMVMAIGLMVPFASQVGIIFAIGALEDRHGFRLANLMVAMDLLFWATLYSAVVSAWATFWATRVWRAAEGEHRMILGRGVARAALTLGLGLVLLWTSDRLEGVYEGMNAAHARGEATSLTAPPRALWVVSGLWATACVLGVIGLAASGARRAELPLLVLLGLVGVAVVVSMALMHGAIDLPPWLCQLLL